MIKIVIIINELLVGGAQRVVVDLVNNIDINKFEINLILLKSQKAFSSNLKWLDEEIDKNKINFITISDRSRFSFREFKKLHSTLKEIKPDIVHTFLPYAGIVGRVVAFLSGVKNIISTQCNVPVAYSFKVYLLDKITLLLVKLWIAPTEGIEYEYSGSIAIYNTKAYLEGRKHFTINFAIDTVKINKALENIDRPKKRRELNIPENVKVVAMTARLHTWKGQEDLIDAMAKLDANIHLVLIGDGVMKQSLEAQVRSLDIEGRVHFLGTRSDVFEILAISDIYVQAHRIEKDKVWVGRNSAQTEAAAIGLPSISTNVPLIEEFIQDGVNGKIVESNNPEMMAQAIKWFLDNPEETKQIAKKLQVEATKGFSIERAVSLHEQLYADLYSK